MPSILSCTDGSPYAASVYDHTAWAALRMRASVRVLHILEPHRERSALADYTGSIGIDAREHLEADLVAFEEAHARLAQSKSRAILEEARQRLTAAGVAEIATEHRHGTLVEALEELEPAAALVVLGKRGESADLARAHLGTNVERVIRGSHHPVLVVPPAYTPIQRYLIAFDGGPSALKAVDFAAHDPLLQGLHCILLTVGHDDPAAVQQLHNATSQLRASAASVTPLSLPGHPEQVITGQLAEHQAQLLLMGAYGHSRIRQFIVGSTTTTMVRTSPVPLLMFR